MLISFTVPFYGSVAMLRRCLESIAAQTDGDFEVVVVDDCSSEDGETLTRSFGSRFRYVRQPENMKCYQARKRAALESRGDYLVPVDPDDYVLPDLVENLRKDIGDGSPDMVVYNVEQDVEGKVVPHWCRYEPGTFSPLEVLERMARKRLQWNLWSKAIRRTIWLEALRRSRKLCDVRINPSDDFCIVVPVVLECASVKVVQHAGYRYCQNVQSICHVLTLSKSARAVMDTWRARRVVLDYVRKKSCDSVVGRYVSTISWMIIGWWVCECAKDIKRRVVPAKRT